MRLVSLDRYVPSLSLVDDAIRSKAHPLLVTGFASTVLWIIFATLLYLCEEDHSEEICNDDETMAERFKNVPNAMQYTMILLTGDYPLINFRYRAVDTDRVARALDLT